MNQRIIVYGSLKKGGKLYPNMERGQAVYLGEVTFPGQLWSLGPYPAAKPAQAEGDVIHGEAYEVGDELIKRLDSIEGHPWQYKREKVWTAKFGECQVYIYQRKLHATDKRIENGIYNVEDWK